MQGVVARLVGWRLVAWIREGYPAGVPGTDYVPLIALLRRRLSDDAVKMVSRELVASGTLPPDPVDIGVEITKVTDEMPAPTDVDRVRERLRSRGWPVHFPDEDEDEDED